MTSGHQAAEESGAVTVGLPAPLPTTGATGEQTGRVRGIVLLGALIGLPVLAIDAYLPALPSLARDLATTPAASQLTLTSLLLGLAVGQLVIGPLSDIVGRRPPLIVGLAAFVLASVLCAAAPSVEALFALRLLQGLAGGAAVVIARALVRDQATGNEAARAFATLMLIVGVAPVVAPVLGAQLLRVTSWRGVFIGLAVVGLPLLAVTALRLAETLPAERRTAGGLGMTLRVFRLLLADRVFIGYAGAGGLCFGAMFAYISGSTFVLQEIYGLSPQAYSADFAANAAGFVATSQVGGHIVGRVGAGRLLALGLLTFNLGGLGLLIAILLDAPLPVILGMLWVFVSSVGFVSPNATALALAGHGNRAGSASALMGVLQFAVGAAAAPLVGLGGPDTAVPMAVVMASLTAGAVLLALLARQSTRAAREQRLNARAP